MAERTVLITGSTGQQGGAVIQALHGQRGFKLKAMTRKPDSEAAKRLASLGLEVVQADLDDEASLRRAVAGAWGVFAVQNTWEAGVEREEEQGKRLARVAREAGVEHFVYSSVGSAHRNTGIPHFDNKWRVEETVRELGFPSHVIFRPVFFMENLISPWFLQGDKLVTAMKPDTALQMIAVEDVGRFEAQGFTRAEELNRREVDVAGDSKTMSEAAKVLSVSLGRTIELVQIPLEEVRKNSVEFAMMLEWFETTGYNADVPALEREFSFKPLKLAEWARQHARA
jgi:uncharacterized protein YbjT (DUF2867 family)